MRKEFKNVSIKRENNSISLSFGKEKDIEVEIYYNDNPNIDGNEKLIIKTIDSNVEFNDPLINKRSFYMLKANGYEDYIIGETLVPLEGLCNFRDLGGIKSKNGKKVKWNKFFRAEQLGNLTKDDFKFLESIKLKTILDFRSAIEVKKCPDPEIEGAKYINISGMQKIDKEQNENFDMIDAIKNYSEYKSLGNPIEYLASGYKDMMFDNKAFKTLIKFIESSENLPIVQHCTAGKDRTGIGSALILLVLGVEEETVIEDYMASNIYRKKANDIAKKSLGDILTSKEAENMFDAIMQVRREYIENAFQVAKDKYGTMDKYLEVEYDLTNEKRETLMAEYLY